ncbi:hypothetical protein Q8A67_006218 [Cirrhinus molitorella]|uniref:Uncharacterized protein n=1 Tax=Cirrhinus molitorella TaxID=172907 RepID=A0AA88Q7G8_9TELE|nr:hypothetical protein Q8A67_006218 [Cirrhinus molitorella]
MAQRSTKNLVQKNRFAQTTHIEHGLGSRVLDVASLLRCDVLTCHTSAATAQALRQNFTSQSSNIPQQQPCQLKIQSQISAISRLLRL